MQTRKMNVGELAEIAMLTAFSFALSYIPLQIGSALIDISLGLVPLAVLGIRRGVWASLTSGFIWSLLLIIFGKAFILNLTQGILEYPIAFTMAGLFGLFSKSIFEKKGKNVFCTILCMAILGVGARWFCHFLAGMIFWATFVPEQNPFIYSFTWNGISFLLNVLLVTTVIFLLWNTSPNLFKAKRPASRS
ncbi:thiamine transporter [Pilibacter termitis]|uniref:Thiamine transporter n=1 Tax=Pilibacter termitis TaxID=263852 RepID=A0A1T4Q1S1_9ENTE|nr:energy-coupled thiamine transporter ThiT [Pilibacter termitis]SJZ97755.1 thiamine transporter [Pilibacter termitis]